MELWERLIKQSLEQGTQITVTYLSNSEIKSVSGVVMRVQGSTGIIIIAGKDGGVGVRVDEIMRIKE